MDIKIQNRLSYNQAKQTVKVAITLGILLGILQIGTDLLNESKQMDITISQTVELIIGSAESALYNLDDNLAKKIVQGLFKYEPISKVDVIEESGEILFSLERNDREIRMGKLMALFFDKNKHYVFPLYHEKGQKIGIMKLTVDRYLMAGNFLERARVILISGMVRNCILAIILTLIFYYNLTLPLLRIVTNLTQVDPENPSEGKIDSLKGHEKDEMGLLVNTINGLLTDFGESQAQKFAAEHQLSERENLIRSIMDNVPYGIITINDSGTVETCNPAAMELFGYEKNDFVGISVSRLFHEYEKSLIYERINESLSDSALADRVAPLKSSPQEAVAIRNTGNIRVPVEIQLGMMIQNQRRLVICVVSDISDRKESERALLESETKYKRLSESLEQEVGRKASEIKEAQSQLMHHEKMASIGHLAAGVAHEINNPMGFISSNLKMMKDYTEDLTKAIRCYRLFIENLKNMKPELSHDKDYLAQLNSVIEQIEKLDIDYILNDVPNLINESSDGADRINQIVSNLKDFAHPGEEKPMYADLVKCIESTINIVWNELKYKTTLVRSYSDIPKIFCYPRQLNQVIMNLLVNAAQAIDTKGTIEIAAQDFKDYIELSIRDSGIGIPEENLPKIFDPFFTTKAVGKGTGLGLNMVYNIIKKHHGTIEVKSIPGSGTVFTIKLLVHPDLSEKSGQDTPEILS